MDVLEKEITGGAVTVEIRGSVRPLAYPMHNVILFKRKSGISLFDLKSWSKIDLEADPEIWLDCLWAGLHEQQSDKTWKAPYTIEELEALIDFSNAGEIARAMVNALMAFMPKAKDGTPNGPAPAAAEKLPAPTQSLKSEASGPELVASASPATSS